MKLFFHNLLVLCALILGLALPGQAANTAAPAAPESWRDLGAFAVLPLLDGAGSISLDKFLGPSDAELMQVAGTREVPSAYNVFAIRQGQDYYLVDTGGGDWLGKRGGLLPEALAAASIPVERVVKIFITHMHSDHAGGLVKNGHPFFVNAQVYVSHAEFSYWTNEENMSKLAKPQQTAFARAHACLVVLEKAGKLVLFEPNDELLPGLVAWDLAGHTPGHCGFMLSSKGKKLMFIGDLLHGGLVQLPRPDIVVQYDIDPDKARAVRLRVLAELARDKVPVASAHLPFPAMGTLLPVGDGYRFINF